MPRAKRSRVYKKALRLFGPPLGDGPWRVDWIPEAEDGTVRYARFRAYVSATSGTWIESIEPSYEFQFLSVQSNGSWKVSVVKGLAAPAGSVRHRYRISTQSSFEAKPPPLAAPPLSGPWIQTWHGPGVYEVSCILAGQLLETAFLEVELLVTTNGTFARRETMHMVDEAFLWPQAADGSGRPRVDWEIKRAPDGTTVPNDDYPVRWTFDITTSG